MAEDATPTEQKARAPIVWKADEYAHAEKGSDWYWALGLIAVAGAVAALMYNNVLFAVFILIAAFVLAVFATRRPEHISFAVTQRGIRIDDTLYPFQSLESFAIEDLGEKHTPKLILESRKMFALDIVIPIEDVDPDEVHEFLMNFLPESDRHEPLVHKIMEWLGF